MSTYRRQLPQLRDELFLTDGGLETTLIFHEGIELPDFAAYTLLKNAAGRDLLRQYYLRYAEMARPYGCGFILESPTWRASADWGARLGDDARTLADLNRAAIGLMLEVRPHFEAGGKEVVISGCLGPRGDGYRPDRLMSAREARDYHAPQVDVFAQTEAEMVAAFTMTHVEEAVGIAAAAAAADIPVAISFTVETDGRLPSGDTLERAIARTDEETDGAVAYYMINCAHPSHFEASLQSPGAWRQRIRGLRSNASRRSHAELDESTDLDAGNPEELGEAYLALRPLLPRLTVAGGCCGTDHRHVDAMCRSLLG